MITKELDRSEKERESISINYNVCWDHSVPLEDSGFSCGHVWMWELDYKESWVPKNWCFWTVLLEKTLESPLVSKETQPIHPKGNQSQIFIGKTDAEAETPIFWPPDVKYWLILKDPDAGKDWKLEEKGTTEDEMVGRDHQHDGHEFEQTLGGSERQGNLMCCSPWGHKQSDTTEWLNNSNGGRPGREMAGRYKPDEQTTMCSIMMKEKQDEE